VPAYEVFSAGGRDRRKRLAGGLRIDFGFSDASYHEEFLLDSTDFYYWYKDHAKEMRELEEKMGVYFRKVIDVAAKSPAEVILVGANFDDMLTYPSCFQGTYLPWLQGWPRISSIKITNCCFVIRTAKTKG